MKVRLEYLFDDDDSADGREEILLGPGRALSLGLTVLDARQHIRDRLKYGELTEAAERELEQVAEVLSAADTEWIK